MNAETTYPRTDGRWMDGRNPPQRKSNISGALSEVARGILQSLVVDRSRPEPGAVKMDGSVLWTRHPVLFVPEGWHDPDEQVRRNAQGKVIEATYPTCSFLKPPQPVVIPAGVKVYRVIGLSPDGRLGDTIAGSWWSFNPPPATEAEWRAGCAVCGHWNADGGFVEVTLAREVRAWVGLVAMHRSVADGYVLPGGLEQIYVSPGTIDPLGAGCRLDDILRPTPWREVEMRRA